MTNLNKKDICCPTCNRKGTWTPDNPSRPFCSERCKLVDLGDWASEKHRIPDEPLSPDDEQSIDNTDEP